MSVNQAKLQKIAAIVNMIEEPVDDKTEMAQRMDQFGGNFDDAYDAGQRQGKANLADTIRSIVN